MYTLSYFSNLHRGETLQTSASGWEGVFADWESYRPVCFLSGGLLTDTLLTDSAGRLNDRIGLALFDACPSRARRDGLPGPDGQALDKAPGRKPRNEARPFSRRAALWAFERRPIAQVRDEHGAARGAACCVKPLRAFGGMGDVPAAQTYDANASGGRSGARPGPSERVLAVGYGRGDDAWS